MQHQISSNFANHLQKKVLAVVLFASKYFWKLFGSFLITYEVKSRFSKRPNLAARMSSLRHSNNILLKKDMQWRYLSTNIIQVSSGHMMWNGNWISKAAIARTANLLQLNLICWTYAKSLLHFAVQFLHALRAFELERLYCCLLSTLNHQTMDMNWFGRS